MPFGVAMFVPINRKVLVYKRQEGLVMEEEIIEDRLIISLSIVLIWGKDTFYL